MNARSSCNFEGSSAFLAAWILVAGCSSSSGSSSDAGDASPAEGGGADAGGGGEGPDGSAADAMNVTSTDAGPGEGGASLDAGNAALACADYAAAYCNRYKACSTYWFQRTWGDDATCRARNSLGCPGQFTAKGSTWTPAGLEACVAALPTASCQEFLMLSRLPAACTPTPGTLAAGSGCAVDAQCAGQVCLFGSFGSCGTCNTLGASGDVCFETAACGPGMLCYGFSSPGNCTPYALDGGSCAGAPCAPWLVCQNGVCGKPEGVGGACSSNPSAFDPCDHYSGIFCDNTTMMCVALVPDVTNQSCNGNSICTASYDCATDGTCIPPLKEGDYCAVLSGPACMAPSLCDNGLCTLPDPARCTAPVDAGRD